MTNWKFMLKCAVGGILFVVYLVGGIACLPIEALGVVSTQILADEPIRAGFKEAWIRMTCDLGCSKYL